MYIASVFFFPSVDKFVCYEGKEILNDKDTLSIVKYWLTSSEYKVVCHNALFDLWVIKEYLGIDNVPDWDCTMTMSYNYNPMGTHSLASWGEYFDFPKLEFEDFSSGYSEQMKEYNERDCRLTWRLYYYLIHRMPDIYQDVDKPYMKIVRELHENGITIDLEKFDQVIEEVSKETQEVLEKIHEVIPLAPGTKSKTVNRRANICTMDNMVEGGYLDDGFIQEEGLWSSRKVVTFNPSSSDQIAFALTHLYRWEPTKFSDKTGKPTTDRAVLDELHYPLARLLVEYSELNKLHTTYGESLKVKVKGGKLHTNYNHTVTLTGRLSSSSPNLQNIPSKGDRGSQIRSLFKAREGHKLIGVDIDAFQMRIFAYYLSQYCGTYTGGLDLWYDFNFNSNSDPHAVTASLLFGSTFTKDQRKIAKTINFGTIFGIGAAKMAAQLGIEVKEAQYYLSLLKEKVPAIGRLKQIIWDTCEETGGEIYTLYGRKGYYPNILSSDKGEKERAKRQAFNFLIQGTEADIVKLMQLQVDKERVNLSFVIQCHDEFIIEVPDTERDLTYSTELMNTVIKHDWLPDTATLAGIPITGQSKIGNNWNEVH